MKVETKAITLVKHYLEVEPWIVRTMGIVRNKRRQLVWKIGENLAQGEVWAQMLGTAYATAKEKKVPYIPNLRRNQAVSLVEKHILANMGISCPQK